MRGRIFFAFLASVLSPSVAAALAPELVIFPNDGAPLEVEHPQRQTVAVRSPSLSIRYGYHSSWTPLQHGALDDNSIKLPPGLFDITVVANRRRFNDRFAGLVYPLSTSSEEGLHVSLSFDSYSSERSAQNDQQTKMMTNVWSSLQRILADCCDGEQSACVNMQAFVPVPGISELQHHLYHFSPIPDYTCISSALRAIGNIAEDRPVDPALPLRTHKPGDARDSVRDMLGDIGCDMETESVELLSFGWSAALNTTGAIEIMSQVDYLVNSSTGQSAVACCKKQELGKVAVVTLELANGRTNSSHLLAYRQFDSDMQALSTHKSVTSTQIPKVDISRKLSPGIGYHQNIQFTISQPPGASYTSDPMLVLLLYLDHNTFADRYEISRRTWPSKMEIKCFGDADLEAPANAIQAKPNMVVVRMPVDVIRQHSIMDFEIPIHMRYQPPQDQRSVLVDTVDVFGYLLTDEHIVSMPNIVPALGAALQSNISIVHDPWLQFGSGDANIPTHPFSAAFPLDIRIQGNDTVEVPTGIEADGTLILMLTYGVALSGIAIVAWALFHMRIEQVPEAKLKDI